jgi:hypothetical protein
VIRCRLCKAPIAWATSQRDRPIPLDVEPAPRGNLRLEPLGDGEAPRALFVPELERDRYVGRLYLSHFATCPYAEEFRR